ncbi:hypothetical protein T492DRAFT_975282, partial [Pavlovales sp. CCMP2436]
MADASSAARNQGATTALPGSNSRCGCAQGAHQASACAHRVGKGGVPACRRTHVTTGVAAATSHCRRARSKPS